MKLLNHIVLVAERDYFPLLLQWKNAHPEIDFKLVSKEELADRLSFRFVKNPIPFLLTKGMDYVSAKKWMRILRFGDVTKSEKAKALFDSLPKDLIDVDPLGEYEFRQQPVYLLEFQEDLEAHGLLERKGIPFTDITLEEFGIEPTNTFENGIHVDVFSNKFEQFSYLFSALRKRLLSKEIEPKDVVLRVQNEGDAYYLKLLGSLFGVKVRMRISQTLLSNPEISEAMENAYASKDIKGLMNLDTLKPFFEEYRFDTLPFDVAYPSLSELLSSTSSSEWTSDCGIPATSDCSFLPGREVYLTSLQYGDFHAVYADDDVLTDDELSSMGLNPSYVKTLLDQRKKKNYLRFHRFALISRVKQHLDEKIYPSQFLDGNGAETLFDFKLDGIFTSEAAKVLSMHSLDRLFYRDTLDDYRSYDSRFKGITGYVPPNPTWSITRLESYVRCPYRYYLNEIVPKSDYDIRPAAVGEMVHKVMETVYKPDFDLEQAILDGRDSYRTHIADKGEVLTPYDEALMDLTASNLRRHVPLFREQLNHSKILESYSELPVQWSLSDGKETYSFRGRVDNVLVAGDENGRYLIINDFKTGSESFRPYEVFLGLSTQLPMYYFGLKQQGFFDKEGAAFGGMGIKHVASSSLTTAYKDKDVLTLKKAYGTFATYGVFSSEDHFRAVFDDTMAGDDGKSTFRGNFLRNAGNKAVFNTSGEGFLSSLSGARAYGLDELVQDAIDATLKAIRSIENGEFPIAPVSKDLRKAPNKPSDTFCSSCPFKDICYRDFLRDRVDLSTEVRIHFIKRRYEE